jgi:hypothetical protein
VGTHIDVDRCGVPLLSILARTRDQGATLDAAVVARILHGRVEGGYLGTEARVIVGWDGALPPSPEEKAAEANARLVARTWAALTGVAPPFDEEAAMREPAMVARFLASHDIGDVTTEYLAGLVQRLFPLAWDEERALREEIAAMRWT